MSRRDEKQIRRARTKREEEKMKNRNKKRVIILAVGASSFERKPIHAS